MYHAIFYYYKLNIIYFAIIIATFSENTTHFQRILIQTYYESFILQHLPQPQRTQVDQRMHCVRPIRLEQELQPRVDT